MVEHIRIENVALIEYTAITFGPGLNILSGETGAGKSMLIGALSFVLGGRAQKDFIRHGQEEAAVEAVFAVSRQEALNALVALDTPADEEGKLLLSRKLGLSGKSVCKINGRVVTLGLLKEVAAILVDMHSQHEHQSLFDPNRQLDLLDKFCGEALAGLKARLGKNIEGYKQVMAEINSLSGDGSSREETMAFLAFQRDEIAQAKLSEDEEEQLANRRKQLLHLQKLTQNSFEALALMDGEGDENRIPALQLLDKAVQLVADMAEVDNSLVHLAENLETLSLQMSDAVKDLQNYADRLTHDPGELLEIEERLNLIYRLKKQYGGSVASVLAHGRQAEERLLQMAEGGKRLNELSQEKKAYTKAILDDCEAMSQLRQRYAADIANRLAEVLQDLGMKNARFDMVLERKKAFSANGYDKVSFWISPNQGEPLKPLAKIASGGEMSRVMLALKTVFADTDMIETFIFDEIDAGVSGRTAQRVGERMALLARGHQILCITHLPQIAAMGHQHYLIEKRSDEGKTVSSVHPLNFEESTKEVARLMGGASITPTTLKAATELKKLAAEILEEKP